MSLRADDDTLTLGWLADLEKKAQQAPVSSYGSAYGTTYFGQNDGLTPAAADLPLYLNVVVAASIGWLARNLPVADLHVISTTRQGDGPEIPNHPFITLMDRPNASDDFFSFWQSFLFSDVIRGDTLFVKLPNRGGGIHSLWWIAPWDFQVAPNPERDADRPILHYEVRSNGYMKNYLPEEVVHIRDGKDPLSPFRGMAPLMAGLRAATTVDRTEYYTQTLMRNCGAISGMLSPSSPDMTIDPKNVPGLQAQFASRTTGENNGRPLVSTQSLRFEKMALSPEQMGIDKLRDFPAASLAALIGVPLMVLGFPDPGKTYSNLSEGDRQAWNNGLIPRMARAAEAFNRQCPELIKPNQRLKWDYKHVKALQEDWVSKIEALVKATGGKAIWTVNEAREATHLKPIDGQDDLPEPAPEPKVDPNAADPFQAMLPDDENFDGNSGKSLGILAFSSDIDDDSTNTLSETKKGGAAAKPKPKPGAKPGEKPTGKPGKPAKPGATSGGGHEGGGNPNHGSDGRFGSGSHKPKPASKPGTTAKPAAKPKTLATVPKGKPLVDLPAATAFETEVAKSLKGRHVGDTKPTDVIVTRNGVDHAIEVKTAQFGAKKNVSMQVDARLRKIRYTETTGAKYHTVVKDIRDKGPNPENYSGHDLYYKRGADAYSYGSMYKAQDLDEVNRLIDTPDHLLPKAAQSVAKADDLEKLAAQAEIARIGRNRRNQRRRDVGKEKESLAAAS